MGERAFGGSLLFNQKESKEGGRMTLRMARRLTDIQARIAEIEKLRQAEDAREKRVLQAVAGVYAKQEKIGLERLGPLLEKVGLRPADIEEFFAAEEQEARRRIEEVTPQLQLTTEELELVQMEERAIRLIDPCAWVHSSPGWICVWHAASCDSSHWETANASGSCVCNTPNNECNPKVEARGQGSKGWRSAFVHSWCYFDIPARPTAATVHVDALVNVHGFYVLRPATGSARVTLELEMKGFQYGYSWATATSSVLNLSGDTMGRYDATRSLQFDMPVGADPFVVRISAKLRARAKRGGALAVGDFATGAGNFIKTIYVNTYSP